MREIFIKTIEKMASENKNLVFLTADMGFKLFDSFRGKYPERFVNVGIAEADMIGIAAGLALSGKNVYCYTLAPFITMRCLEQIKVDVCYHNLNVKLLGIGGGIAYGVEGVTHHGPEDFSVLRAIPNITIVSPTDDVESRVLAEASVVHKGPIYFRLTKGAKSEIQRDPSRIKIGKGDLLREGTDCMLISCGEIFQNVYQACEILNSKNVNTGLISMHTIKPLDTHLIEHWKKRVRAIITVEEHSIIGGLGTAVAEYLAESRYQGLFLRIGLPDMFNSYVGSADYLRTQYGFSPSAIARSALKLLE